jgi:hypothetical protein
MQGALIGTKASRRSSTRATSLRGSTTIIKIDLIELK